MMKGERRVVFFDGECLLCSGVVRWCHRVDHAGVIWFASLDSQFADQHREELGLPPAGEGADTFAFWNGPAGEVAFRSAGATELLKCLGGGWCFLGKVMSRFPRMIRDGGYNLVARNRRKWFGSAETCTMPPGSLRGRVLE